jgi:two-component system sporulation sensor kinase B
MIILGGCSAVADFIKDLCLHFFIMMIIPLIHILLSRKEKERTAQIIFAGIIIFTLLVTMLFPVHIYKGGDFDFKFIPIFVAFFYGGPLTGIIGVLALVLIDFITQDVSIPIILLNYGIISVTFYYIGKRYHNFTLGKKFILAFLLYLVISATRFIVIFNMNKSDLYIYLLLFSVVSYITLAFVLYLIEIHERQLFMIQKLQNTEKLNSVSQLAASVAHEIRNPLTTIRGFLQLLKDEKNLTSSQIMFVTISLNELDRAKIIIDDFLSLARPNNNQYHSIDISLLLQEITDFMRQYAIITGTEINTEIKNQLIINGSSHEFKQLIINLIRNGIEAMPKGGKLQVNAFSEGSHNVVTIKDQGVGLSPAQLKQLGQPYYSTKSKGTGLGLLITFDIVKRMNGKVIIESKVQEGTLFTITFPKQPPSLV